MTREEAIKILKSKLDGSVDTSWEWTESVRMAIEALSAEAVHGKVSDLIMREDAVRIVDQFSREEMFRYMESLELDVRATQICHSAIEAVGTIKEQIEALPSADRPTRVYEYLRERIGDIVDSEAEFEAWFERMVWHVEECNRLADRPTGECRTCGRNADNGGVHEDGRTKCPIQEHYALLLDGYCHLYEPYNCGAKMGGAE